MFVLTPPGINMSSLGFCIVALALAPNPPSRKRAQKTKKSSKKGGAQCFLFSFQIQMCRELRVFPGVAGVPKGHGGYSSFWVWPNEEYCALSG